MVDTEIRIMGNAADEVSETRITHMVQEAADQSVRIARLGKKKINIIMRPSSLEAEIENWHKKSRKAFLLYFGFDKNSIAAEFAAGIPNHMKVVQGRLNTLVHRLDKDILVKVRPSSGSDAGHCTEGLSAFQESGPLGNRTFSLCPRWFELKPLQTRAIIMLHEMFHAMGSFGFTTDLKLDGKKVRSDVAARELARRQPGDARRNPENYEHFFQYLIRVPSRIGRQGWKGIKPHMDAAIMHPNGKAYFFYGNKYLRYDFTLKEMDKEGTIGKDGWFGLKGKIDTAIVHPINGKGYFFSGNQYQRYDFKEDKVDLTRTIGAPGWNGLKKNLHAAIMHPKDGKAYFFKNVAYASYDFVAKKTSNWGIVGDADWKGLSGHFDAAIMHPTNGKAYFFVGNHYYRYNFTESAEGPDNIKLLR